MQLKHAVYISIAHLNVVGKFLSQVTLCQFAYQGQLDTKYKFIYKTRRPLTI